ncbi:hypothetical protein FAM09_16945 [Niastella caeni]|uniref:WG repeat-containing protein n=1 Tax=Niastella caeni TaxID=2569763 RepID=A0A4S8HTJ9_9BACT|nr:WG repeat-containing protein [Niastella caeni]THU38361.1 hypothetical protein FAM09_16945 [Niastella caeni]
MKALVYLCLMLCTLAGTAQTTLYPYSDGKLWGLTNANRDVITPPQFDTIDFFYGSTAILAVKNKKYGTIGRDGKTRIDFTYDKIIELPEGLGLGAQKGKYLLLNLETNKLVSPAAYDTLNEYCRCEEKLFIATRGGKKVIISGITGKQAGQTAYDQARFYNRKEGSRAIVKTGGKYGLIDTKTGAPVIPVKYDKLEVTYRNYKDVVQVTAKGKTQYLDFDGKPVAEEPRPETGEEETVMGLGVVEAPADEDYGKDLYVYNLGNNNWKLTIENRSNGGAKVFQTFNVQGYTSVTKMAYRNWDSQMPAIIKAIKDGKAGIIGLKGDVLVPFEYDNIEEAEGESYYRTTKDNKVGVLKNNLAELRKPVLKRVVKEEYRFNAYLVELPNGQRGYMDQKTGKIYIPGIEE